MEQRKILIYLKGSNNDDILTFLNTFEELYIKTIKENFILISIDELDKELLTVIRDFSMTELYQDLVAFILPKCFDLSIDDLQKILPRLNPNIYSIETVIPELIFLKENDFINKLRNHYYSKFNSETIETIIGFINENMNASKTAKSLYMHRNTLNYRLDNFIDKTGIDVRTFSGALAIYMLFRR